MKFNTFLIRVQEYLAEGIVDIKTVKILITDFEECLSPFEKEVLNTPLEMIKSYKSN